MTEGTRTEDIKDIAPASKEAAEARAELDKVTLEPEAALEKDDFQQDEEIQEAFTAAVPPAENTQALESPLLITSLDGKTNDPGDHYSGVEMAQGEVAQDSDWNESDPDSDTNANLISGTNDGAGESASSGASAGFGASASEGEGAETGASAASGASAGLSASASAGEASGADDSSSAFITSEFGAGISVGVDTSTSSGSEGLHIQTEDSPSTGPYKETNRSEGSSDQNEGMPIKDGAHSIGEGQTASEADDSASPGEVREFTIQDLEEESKDWEEKLNSIGDDAELADIDLQGTLDKQQETIDMLAAMGKVQRDTADTVIKKTTSGLTSAAESDETGENDDNQIVIPAGNNLINFAGAVSELTKVDSFTSKLGVSTDETGDFRVPSLHKAEIDPLPERTASGDHQETAGDAADLKVTKKEDPPQYDPDLKPEPVPDDIEGTGETDADQKTASINEVSGFTDGLSDQNATGKTPIDINTLVQDVLRADYSETAQDLKDTADGVQSQNETKNGIREEIVTLQDELGDWPDDGSTREITYSEWEEGENGTMVKVKITVTLTKDEAEALLEKMGEDQENKDSRGDSEGSKPPYQLAEGRILVSSRNMFIASDDSDEDDTDSSNLPSRPPHTNDNDDTTTTPTGE